MSVLIPSYNHARYIERCLDGVVEDGYPELEVIVLDDGSVDASCQVIEAWRRRHPDAFRSFRLLRQANRGITPTLNRLLSEATGEFVVYVASDDYLLPGGIGARVEALERHPQWLAVFADCVVVDAEGCRTHDSGLSQLYHVDKQALLASAEERALELIVNWGVPGPVLLARRTAFDPATGVGGFDESLFVEDRDFYLRLLARNALGFVDRIVSTYRVSDSSACHAPEWRPHLHASLVRAEERNVGAFRGRHRRALALHARMLRYQERATGPRSPATLVYRAAARACRYLQLAIRRLPVRARPSAPR